MKTTTVWVTNMSTFEDQMIADLKGVVTVARAEKVAAALTGSGNWCKADTTVQDAIENLIDLARNYGEGPVMLGSIEVAQEFIDNVKERS